MKNSIFYFILLAFTNLLSYNSYSGNPDTNSPSVQGSNNSFRIGSSQDLQTLTQSWVDEYSRIKPDVTINLSTAEEVKEIQILTRDELNSMKDMMIWHIMIGKRVFVPVINVNHPVFNNLIKEGITADELSDILTGQQVQKQLPDNFSHHCYLPDNPEVLGVLSAYLKHESADFKATLMTSEEELMKTIQNDIYGIGFCSFEAAIDLEENGFRKDIALMPIDKNNNHRLDYFENIYGSLEEFMRGVWIGKYPTQLTEPIYAASSGQPSDAGINFLSWVISDGHSELKNNGLVVLTRAEAQKGLQLMTGDIVREITPIENTGLSNPMIIIAFVVIGLICAGMWRFIIWSRKASKESEIQLSGGFNEKVIEAPKGIFFDKSHTWAYMEQDGSVKVGVDDFLQHLTGPLTKVKMKENGETVRKGEKFMTIIRNGKQLDLYSPVSGVITGTNSSLETNTRLINISPYTEGWVYKIEPKNWLREIEFLTMGSRYREWLSTEFSRLKDFFAETVKSNDSAYNHIVLQDGGELADNILADLDPHVWEDFQTRFIDISK